MINKMLLSAALLLSPSGYSKTYIFPSCKSLVHIGDSTSIPISAKLLAKYRKIGFKNVYFSAGNGRSLVYNRLPDKMSGINAIHYYKRKLGTGICWVIALGTNDAASSQSPDDSTRIDLTMEAIDGDRVVWVNVYMNSKRYGYNLKNTQVWNSLLSKKLSIYSNAYIYNWAGLVQGYPKWLSDGYHYTSLGYKNRAEYIPLNVAYFLMP